MITERQKDDLIEAVRATARREIMPRFRNLDPGDVDSKSSAIDLVTEADRATERALAAAARGIVPNAAIIGEEAVAEDASLLGAIGTMEQSVIIDPIDGTGNFASGLAVFGVIVAVIEAGKTVFALLYDPTLDDWAIAEPGSGAWLCRENAAPRRLMTRDTRPLGHCKGLVELEWCDRSDRADFLRRFDEAAQIHDLRCSCHGYRMLASGEADFIVALTLNPWDHAAGQLLTHEAGAWSVVDGTKDYTPLLTDGRMVTASGRDLGEPVASIVF